MPKKMLKEDAVSWLEENAPHLKIVDWGGLATSESLFIDSRNNKNFKKDFRSVKGEIKRNPSAFFGLSWKEISQIQSDSIYRKYGVRNISQIEEVKKLKRQKSLERYGTEYPLQAKEVREKIEETSVKKYGSKYYSQTDECKRKVKKTNLERHGVENPLQNPEIKDKQRKTLLEKYGVENPLQNSKILKRVKRTNLERYGFISPAQNKEVRKKISNKRSRKINGTPLKEVAKNKGIAHSTVRTLVNKYGEDFLTSYNKEYTSIHYKVLSFLKEDICLDVLNDRKAGNSKYKYDCFIPGYNLIIECDGLYWHSDGCNRNTKHKSYHQEKLRAYEKEGYRALFFREDELRDKFDICKSIISNHLEMNKRIFARNCKVSTETMPDFFESNHLMGKGSGRIYSLICDNEIFAAIQVKWRSKEKKDLEISRFCTKNNHSVIGGFSKLLKYVVKEENPNEVVTFIDRRYGRGDYLKNLGFEFKGEHLSFKWTDFQNAYHRMIFPGSSGYEHGLAKIWDCGQAKWSMTI